MNTYEVVDGAGTPVTSAMTFEGAQRYMQENRLNRDEYSIKLYLPRKRKTETPKTELRFTSFDDSESFLCVTDPTDRWNGWVKPLIYSTDLQAMFGADVEISADGTTAKIGDQVFTQIPTPSGTHPEFDGLPVFDLRNSGFCFNDNGACQF